LYWEIIAARYEIHTQRSSTLSGQKVEYVNVNLGCVYKNRNPLGFDRLVVVVLVVVVAVVIVVIVAVILSYYFFQLF